MNSIKNILIVIKKNWSSILDILHKVTPLLTLLFLIFSYYNSVKPVFDKTNELNNYKERSQLLSEKIDIKETELKDFTNQIISASENEKQLNDQVTALQLEKDELKSRNEKFKSEIQQKEQSLEETKISAVIANLKIMEKDISSKEIRNIVAKKDFNIRLYTKEYLSNLESKDIYENEAKIVLQSFSDYKGKYDIENSIFYLNYYYQFIYEN